jgi:hypothetical protein
MSDATLPIHDPRKRRVAEPRPPLLRRLQRDDDGAIMVIGVFMAAVLVGAIWYTWGLGEAMIYRQQLRQGVDATAFDSAVIHALGMNMLAMMNITMAAVLSVLVALEVVFVGALAATIVSWALLVIPGIDIVDTADVNFLVDVDIKLFNTIKKVQPKIFDALASLNTAEGWVAIGMPFAGLFVSTQTRDDYLPAVQATFSFSSSMIPLRWPHKSNAWDKKIKDALPTIKYYNQKLAPTRIPLLSRYGLPVQDDVFGMLCLHAGMELVDELNLLMQASTFGVISLGPLKSAQEADQRVVRGIHRIHARNVLQRHRAVQDRGQLDPRLERRAEVRTQYSFAARLEGHSHCQSGRGRRPVCKTNQGHGRRSEQPDEPDETV